MASSRLVVDISKSWLMVMASVGQASTQRPQKMHRSMLIS